MPMHDPDSKIWRPYTQERNTPPPLEIERAIGPYLHTKNGQRIFDGISSWWLITHGHCTPEISEAVARQAENLDQVIFANFTHRPGQELADLLIQMTPPELTRVFLTDNGSTAVEAALKMALQACAQNGRERKRRFLALKKAYHGDTVGAMSVSGRGVFNQPYRPFLFEVLLADQPTLTSAPIEDWSRGIEELLAQNHEALAGVIIEPLIQGAGGMIVWPDEAVRKIAQLCRRYGVYLIFDEVMTGFGRTGSLFAMDRTGVTPDLLCLSKGLTGGTLPLAATLASEEIYRAFLSEDRGRMFFHGHSFTGNPISCAAAVANLRLLRQNDSLTRLKKIEAIQRRCLDRLSNTVPLRDKRVCGTMAAIEVDLEDSRYGSRFGDSVMRECLKNGVFIRPLGSVFYLLPPYSTSENDLEWAWEVIEDAVKG